MRGEGLLAATGRCIGGDDGCPLRTIQRQKLTSRAERGRRPCERLQLRPDMAWPPTVSHFPAAAPPAWAQWPRGKDRYGEACMFDRRSFQRLVWIVAASGLLAVSTAPSAAQLWG